ncbi:MAG: hypothetical protein QF890_03180 [Myxococcota bacterium]|nr:hypothetical protein [Myxococcota bacterium]MDP7431558.1 hypothetical protein [Myxococcota bacterium]
MTGLEAAAATAGMGGAAFWESVLVSAERPRACRKPPAGPL